MLNWTVHNKDGIKHYVVLQKSELSTEFQVHICRTGMGHPLKIYKEFDIDTPFGECVSKIENLCNLDNEVYKMLHEHQKSELE